MTLQIRDVFAFPSCFLLDFAISAAVSVERHNCNGSRAKLCSSQWLPSWPANSNHKSRKQMNEECTQRDYRNFLVSAQQELWRYSRGAGAQRQAFRAVLCSQKLQLRLRRLVPTTNPTTVFVSFGLLTTPQSLLRVRKTAKNRPGWRTERGLRDLRDHRTAHQAVHVFGPGMIAAMHIRPQITDFPYCWDTLQIQPRLEKAIVGMARSLGRPCTNQGWVRCIPGGHLECCT